VTAGRAAPVASGLAERLGRHLDRSRLVGPGTPVLVALSGGLDSVALLHLLRFPLRERVGALSAAHLDHAMRADSDADARWVAGLCRAWDVPLSIRRAEPPPRSEAEARSWRYTFLEDAAPSGVLIATGHHADDQAETVLFRLARGTGLRGLRGIAPRWGRVVRPLLPFQRTELEEYAQRAGLAYRSDPTNLELRFARNRIRHRVLPELERVRPGVVLRLAALALDAGRAEAAWEQALEAVEKDVVLDADACGATLARDRVQAYHPQLRARLLRRLLRRYGTPPGRAGTQAALEFINSGPSGGSVHLPAGLRLERDFDRVRIVAPEPAAAADALDRVVEIAGAGAGSALAVIGGRPYQVRWGSATEGVAEESACVADPRFPLVLRGWRAGDRIRLAYGTKKLKKLLAERRLDRRARARVPVLVDGRGEVLWVVGLARAQGVVAGAEAVAGGFPIAVSDAGED
jgi:tRNA(Ile)-lysidine synthase